MRLVDHLQELARLWSVATGRSVSRLATRVVNDGGFFRRIEGGGGFSDATFEKFLAFFRSGENWPDNRIPLSAAELLDRLENIAVSDETATGQSDDVSRQQADAASDAGLPHRQGAAA